MCFLNLFWKGEKLQYFMGRKKMHNLISHKDIWWKKSHCMLAHRAARSQLRLGDAIGRNVHTSLFNGRTVHRGGTWLPAANYALARNSTFFPLIWTQNVVCTSSDMMAMWLVWIPPSLRSGEYTSHSSQSSPCRPWYTIYYYLTFYDAAVQLLFMDFDHRILDTIQCV